MGTMYSARSLIVTVLVGALICAPLAVPAAAQTTPPDEIVLWTSSVAAADIHGDWVRLADPAAAGGIALHNPDRGRAKISPALESPANYFEIRFSAKRATAYQLWVRMRAQNNSYNDDAVHVQFSDSVDSNGSPVTRIGTTDSAGVILQAGPSAPEPHGWGWADNGWASAGTPIYFEADGAHVIRIQQRDDGAMIDQIVLSARSYVTTAPGQDRDDATILAATGGLASAPSASTIVIRPATAAAGRMFGNWHTINDSTAAGGQAVRNPDAGAARISPALANPVSYFEATFTASAGRPYHFWLRMRADNDSTSNDAVHVQFSGAVTSSGTPLARIGSTESTGAVLQAGSGAPAPSGWGWADNGWGALGQHVYFETTGTQTIRVQQRDDGVTIDQIVISPDTYLTTSPGPRLDDQTIVPPTSTPPPANVPPTVTLTSPLSGSVFGAPATIAFSATAADAENRLARVDFYNGTTLLNADSSAPYAFTWSNVTAGAYQLKAVAVDADGASTGSSTATVTVGTTTNQAPSVSLTAPSSGATFTAPATISLAASASDPENRLDRVDFRNGTTVLGSDTTSPFTFQWSSVPTGSYTLTAVAHDSDGRSTTSSSIVVTVSTSPPPFPTGWQHQDIGSPAVAGNASFNNGTFTLTGAGADIWASQDEFHFAYKQVTGDVDIVARVASLQGSNGWSIAGVMVRESLADNARHGLAHFTVSNGYRFIRRTATGGTTGDTACAPGAAPGWVRLIRTGSSVEMRYSTTGQTWSSCGTLQIPMTSVVYVGLAVSNVDATRTASGVFDNVAVLQGTANQPPTVSMTAPANGSTFTAPATITLSATAADPENDLARVEFYNGSFLLGSDSSAPFSYTWSSVAAGSYQLTAKAVDADGASTTSSISTVTVGTTSTTKRVAFNASVDHDTTVTSYLLEVFASTANPASGTPITTSSLGKPTPASDGEIIVDRTTFLNDLAPGNYLITVASVGSGGSSRSSAITFTR